jgi:Lantibiotic dehydratase, N terminus
MDGSAGVGGRSPAGHWRVASAPVVRVAGMPVPALTGLRCEHTMARIDQLAELDTWLTATGTALSEALYPVIGATEGTGTRPALAGLRRALHTGRRPSAREWNPTLAATLPRDLARAVAEWVARRAQRDRRHDELPAVLAAERAGALSVLRATLSDAGFRRALGQSAPSLLAEVGKWLADRERLPQPAKLLRLVKYLSRATAKTSPYSTFMAAGFGRWSRQGPAVRPHPVRETLGVVELDGRYLQTVRAALTRHPDLVSVTRVRVNPSLTEADGMVHFLTATESIAAMPLVPTVLDCLRLVWDDPEVTLAELRSNLTTKPGFADEAKTHRFLDRLLAAGLLETYIPVSEHSLDPLGAMARWVNEHRGESLAEVAGLMDRVSTQQHQSVPVADVAGHVRRQESLRHAMTELADGLGIDPASLRTSTKDVLHEVAVVPGLVADCSLEEWRPALGDLDVVRRFLAIFDLSLPARLVLSAYFRERFGPDARIPLLMFYRAVQEELAHEESDALSEVVTDLRAVFSRAGVLGSPEVLGHRRLDRLQMLVKLRAQARETVLGRPGPDGVVRVDPAALAAQMDCWPEWITPPASVGCYVQAAWPGQDLRLVLNSAHGGHGRGRSRLEHLLARAGVATPGGDRPPAHRPQPVLAEWSGLLESTLNMRLPAVPYEIDYPFTVSGRPREQRLPLGDLTVARDPETDLLQLCSTRLDRRVIPVHLGMMVEFVLPAAARFAGRAFSPGYLLHPSMPPLLPAELGTWADGSDQAEPIARHPRVEIGRVVLRRARWSMPVAQVPRRGRGEREAHHLSRLITWLRQEGIPRQVFVRVRGEVVIGEWAKDRKPVYIDFANPWLARIFERRLADGGTVVIEEALPRLDQAIGPEPAHASVTEFLVEITDGEPDHE